MRNLLERLGFGAVTVPSAPPRARPPYRPQLTLTDGRLVIEPQPNITALEAVELFLFVSAVLSDPRPGVRTVAWAMGVAEERGFARHVQAVAMGEQG
jgi:hypothetical protein